MTNVHRETGATGCEQRKLPGADTFGANQSCSALCCEFRSDRSDSEFLHKQKVTFHQNQISSRTNFPIQSIEIITLIREGAAEVMHPQTSEAQTSVKPGEFRLFWHEFNSSDHPNIGRVPCQNHEHRPQNSTNYRVLKHNANGAQEVLLHGPAKSEHFSFASFARQPLEQSLAGQPTTAAQVRTKRKFQAPNINKESSQADNLAQAIEMGKRPPGSELRTAICKRLKVADATEAVPSFFAQETPILQTTALAPKMHFDVAEQALGSSSPACQMVVLEPTFKSSHHGPVLDAPPHPRQHRRREMEHLLSIDSTLDNSSCFRAAKIELPTLNEHRKGTFDPRESRYQRDERFLQNGANQLTLFMGEMTPVQAQAHGWTYLNTFYKREQEHVEKNALIETYFEGRKSKLEKLIRQ